MNHDPYRESDTSMRPREMGKVTIYAIAILAILLIGYLLSHAMRAYLPKQAVNAARAAERSAALAEVRATGKRELGGDPVYINKANGVVRLPIDRAMELTVQNYKNGAAWRSNLLERVENATKAPAKPPAVQFE